MPVSAHLRLLGRGLQGGGDDEAVARVAVHILQISGANGNFSVYGISIIPWQAIVPAPADVKSG